MSTQTIELMFSFIKTQPKVFDLLEDVLLVTSVPPFHNRKIALETRGCGAGCQMLTQSNIKPYVSLLWLPIAGAEQSIGTIREVLKGGAGCDIKGLWRENMSALIRSDHAHMSEGGGGQLWNARTQLGTHEQIPEP